MNAAGASLGDQQCSFTLSGLTITIDGTLHWAATGAGNRVRVWKPANYITTPRARYFCHGHALGTFAQHGYTVFSDFMTTVLEDEYEFLGFDSNLGKRLAAGDIAVWVSLDRAGVADPLQGGTVLTPTVHRSARVTNPAGAGGIIVSSKNSFTELVENCTLAAVMKTYERTKASVQFHRRK